MLYHANLLSRAYGQGALTAGVYSATTNWY
jgi:hypothetical protein